MLFKNRSGALLLLPIIGLGVYFLAPGEKGQIPSGTAEITGVRTVESRNAANPYLISSMQKREYDSEIVVGKKIRETAQLVFQVVSYDSDGSNLNALMIAPKGEMPDSGWPVMIVNHGYIDPEVYSTENSYINTSTYFANAGFLVFKPDYRGHDESEGESGSLVSRIGYAADVLNLLSGVRKLPEANADRIFMYGHSMGGDVTMRVMEICGNCVKAATLWAPAVSDWPESSLYFSRRADNDPKQKERAKRFERELGELFKPHEYEGVSTLANAGLVNSPVNIHHGTRDESVPFGWGETLAEKFREGNKEFHFYTYAGDNHDIAGNWSTALSRDVDLFRSVN